MNKRYIIDDQTGEVLDDNGFEVTLEDIVDRLNYLEEQLKNCIKPNNQYVEFGEYKNKPYLTGWVCPKCGAVMSPYQNTCTNCLPPKKLEIWC